MTKELSLVIIFAALIIGSFIFLGFYISKPKPEPSLQITGMAVTPIEPEEDSFEESAFKGSKFVTKIIDGDTVIIEGNSVRLLGIDSDERGYPCYSEAKERIEEIILNKEVEIESDGEDKDQYGRYLRYIFLDGKNINLQLVKEGLAVARFSPENTKYKKEILAAEKRARENKIGCKWRRSKAEPEPEYRSEPEEEDEEEEEEDEPDSVEIIGACNAGNYIGEEKIVQGKIVDTYKYQTVSVFLNLEKPYPNTCFTAVIWSSDWHKFPENPEDYYDGKTVRIQGEIIEYQGTPEIILKDMGQVSVL
jgi:micrococcal nuclease